MAFMAISYCGFSQISTTQEEYTFLTEEYPETQKVKEGYTLDQLFEAPEGNFVITYMLLKETATGNTKAAFIKITKNKSKERYLCLPFNNQQLMADYLQQSQKLGVSMTMIYHAANDGLLSSLLNQTLNNKK